MVGKTGYIYIYIQDREKECVCWFVCVSLWGAGEFTRACVWLLIWLPSKRRPDITVMVDWALKINYLYIYLSIYIQKEFSSKRVISYHPQYTVCRLCISLVPCSFRYNLIVLLLTVIFFFFLQTVAAENGISAMPTFLFFKNGKKVICEWGLTFCLWHSDIYVSAMVCDTVTH